MYARRWSCRCPLEHREGFLRHLNATGVADTARIPGCLGAEVMERELSGSPEAAPCVEITLVTYWRDLEAVAAYAGEDIGQARLYPGDERYGIDSDPFVTHHRVLWHQLPGPLLDPCDPPSA